MALVFHGGTDAFTCNRNGIDVGYKCQDAAYIARELHDTIGHTLTSILLHTQIARRISERGDWSSERKLEKSVSIINSLCDSISGDLNSVFSASETGQIDLGLELERELALLGLAQNWQASLFVDDTSIPPPLLLDVFKLVKECLNNISKHAKATEICVSVGSYDNQILVRVSDDGTGINPANLSRCYGIEGMSERAARCGGRLSIESQPGRGTIVSITIPIRPMLDAADAPSKACPAVERSKWKIEKLSAQFSTRISHLSLDRSGGPLALQPCATRIDAIEDASRDFLKEVRAHLAELRSFQSPASCTCCLSRAASDALPMRA